MFNIIVGSNLESNDINMGTLFYIETDLYIFPDKQWSDLSAAIMANWCRIISSLRCCERIILYFMDGEYSMDCTRRDEKIYIKMIYNSIIKNSVCINFNEFINAILKSSRKILRIAEGTKFSNNTDVITIR